MKFVKENLTLVICGAVVVLALVAWLVWPLPSMRGQLQAEMSERYADKATVDHIGSTVLQLPGQEKPVTGPPNANWVNAKKTLISSITKQQEEVAKVSHEINKQGRISAKGLPILPMAVASGTGWTWGKEEPGVLPKVSSNEAAIAFKQDYINEFAGWASILAKGKLTTGQGIDAVMASCGVPTQGELKDLFAIDQKNKLVYPGSESSAGGQNDTAQEQRFNRNTLLARAKQLHMYVDRTAFQVRPWYTSDEPPTEVQIFTAMVDSWLQADVVRAIYQVNNPGGKAPTDVSQSPIKRLIHITVGNSARAHVVNGGSAGQASAGSSSAALNSDPSLFYTSDEAKAEVTAGSAGPVIGAAIGGGGGGGGGGAAAPAAPNAIDYNVSMTGHASGGQYDVVLMSIWMDIDPAKLVEFIDRLYQQNVGYTVINTQLKTVDPLERAGNGYIYGGGQAVEAEIQVEVVLFREWTTPLMPGEVRAALGVPAAK